MSGCPVLTLPGETFVSRPSASLLQRLEHGKWIATSRDDYVARAIAAASQIDSNRAHRAQLREQVRERRCDWPAQARDMATAIRELWRRACA